jgi:transketolase
MTVIVPADAPTTRTATLLVHDRPGPAYLRLTREDLPTVGEVGFEVGKARELRAGTDLTIVAVGSLVARGLAVAEELSRVGISTRVLDFASVKPFDEPALLRAARDTGAILVLEEHTVLTGVGALVASTTSENYPVPVRRVGVPDVFGESGDPWALLDRYGMSTERIRDEAWELLRARGKVQ